jgi:prepilin-type N-terminal cleavage/methylation domain-containing protein
MRGVVLPAGAGTGLASGVLKPRSMQRSKCQHEGGEIRMISRIRHSKSAFTLVEIMIVVAIIGLLAALAIPGFVKARKQSQGRRAINDARMIDAAVDQWALEKGKSDGDTVNTTEAATYLKGAWPTTDPLGNAYTVGTVGSSQVSISSTTKTALSGVGIDWGPY